MWCRNTSFGTRMRTKVESRSCENLEIIEPWTDGGRSEDEPSITHQSGTDQRPTNVTAGCVRNLQSISQSCCQCGQSCHLQWAWKRKWHQGRYCDRRDDNHPQDRKEAPSCLHRCCHCANATVGRHAGNVFFGEALQSFF
jgi:hypothetical protein